MRVLLGLFLLLAGAAGLHLAPSARRWVGDGWKTLAKVAVSSALLLPCSGVLAAIGEGDLPEGSIAFQKVLKYQKDWRTLTDAIRPRIDTVDDKEVTSIKLFLKQLANEYYDMELLSNSIMDKTKAAEAVALAKNFRAEMRALDDAASKGNVRAVLDAYPATAKELQDFLDMLNDVPDEL